MKKSLIEKRNALIEKYQGIIDTAKTEERAFATEEFTEMEGIKTEITAIDESIRAIDASAQYSATAIPATKTGVKTEEETRAAEVEILLKFIRGDERALDVANNGGVIPTSIANKIIETVKELCPVYAMATVYNVGGDLVFPVYDETTPIGAAYVDDLTELTEATGKFTTVKLQNFIVGSLAKVSKSLMNRTDFDLVSFTVRKVAQAIAEFMGKELILGTTSKMTGIVSATSGVTTASGLAITADELIDLQMSVVEQYQENAVWIMNKSTLKAIRKLKDSNGDYLLTRDLIAGFGYLLLGKKVYIDVNMPVIALGAKAIAYGDMSGLYVKLAQNVELQMLMEKYATQHAIGVVGYVEADSKIVEPQKIRVLTMKAS